MRSILYYPSINIQDGDWLRNAILYWDEICSIVPDKNDNYFTTEITALQELGIYRALYPSDLFVSGAFSSFEKEALRKIKNETQGTFYKNSRHTVKPVNLSKIKWNGLNSAIHYNKMPSKILDYMIEHKLVETSDSQWVLMEEKTADIFMSTLAKYLAKIDSEDVIIGTDKNESMYSAFSKAWHTERSFCLTTVFEKAMPVPNPDIPFERIISFRNKYYGELLQLRIILNCFENDISKCESVEELKSIVRLFREQWELELIQLDKMFKSKKISYLLKNLITLNSVSLPAVISDITNNWGGKPKWLIGAGLGMNGVIGVGSNYISHRNSIKQDKQNASFAYLYEAQKENIIRHSNFHEII